MRAPPYVRGVLLALALLLRLGAQATPPSQLKASDYVNDFAHVLDAGAVAALDEKARALEDRYHVQVALVTVPTTGGEAVGEYAYELATHWGVGTKNDTGLLVLLAIGDHKDSTQVGYGLEPYITDADAGQWMRDQQPALRASNFGAALNGILDQATATLAQRMGAADGAAPQNGPAPNPDAAGGGRRGGGGSALATFLFLLFVVFLFSRATRGSGSGCWLPLLLMNMGGGGRGGGWGGGGFGGGGGGFGGFGGGGFGGGGASGGW